jgi:hypothetical protein
MKDQGRHGHSDTAGQCIESTLVRSLPQQTKTNDCNKDRTNISDAWTSQQELQREDRLHKTYTFIVKSTGGCTLTFKALFLLQPCRISEREVMLGQKIKCVKKTKTYNRRDCQMVTHSSTSRPVQRLCIAERTEYSFVIFTSNS